MGELKCILSPSVLKKILEFAWPKFVEDRRGLIFLGASCSQEEVCTGDVKEPFASPTFHDKTECEAIKNHVHIEDELPIVGNEGLREEAVIVGEMWAAKLKRDFPGKHFRIYMNDCTDTVILRFHQVHEGEPPWLNEEDYEEEIKNGIVRVWTI